MDDDEQMSTQHTLEMTANLVAVTIRVGASSTAYKVTVEYPQGYDEYIKVLLAGAADLFWNGHLFAQSAELAGLRAKPGKDGEPPQFLAVFNCDPGDAVRHNMSAETVVPTGQLRISSTQLALFSR